jgi:hypothetical protein
MRHRALQGLVHRVPYKNRNTYCAVLIESTVLDRTRSWRVDHEVVSIVSILANPAVYGSNPAVFVSSSLKRGTKS